VENCSREDKAESHRYARPELYHYSVDWVRLAAMLGSLRENELESARVADTKGGLELSSRKCGSCV